MIYARIRDEYPNEMFVCPSAGFHKKERNQPDGGWKLVDDQRSDIKNAIKSNYIETITTDAYEKVKKETEIITDVPKTKTFKEVATKENTEKIKEAKKEAKKSEVNENESSRGDDPSE